MSKSLCFHVVVDGGFVKFKSSSEVSDEDFKMVLKKIRKRQALTDEDFDIGFCYLIQEKFIEVLNNKEFIDERLYRR